MPLYSRLSWQGVGEDGVGITRLQEGLRVLMVRYFMPTPGALTGGFADS